MRLPFRVKLYSIVAAAAVALVVLIAASAAITGRAERQLVDIQGRYLPRLELGPRIEAEFDTLRRAFQDAVAARDGDAITATRELEAALLEELARAHDLVDDAQAAALRAAVVEYAATAARVSRRIIAGETGEEVLAAMADMQAKQARAAAVVKSTTAFDRRQLAAAFAAAQVSLATAGKVRLGTGIACLLAVLLLSTWIGRNVMRSLSEVTVGLQRFGGGDFSQPIPIVSRDELGELAAQANQMARDLERLGRDRDHDDWLKAALAGLVHELRGDREPPEVASRACRFLAQHFAAPAAALYYASAGQAGAGAASADGPLALLGQYGGDASAAAEGLVAQAAQQEVLTVVREPPPDHLRVRSGLGESAPRALVFVPLVHLGRVKGVLELALFEPWSERAGEALLSLRETLAIAIEVALGSASVRGLLVETQRQAGRLVQQEEELRATNEELETQQEELRVTNRELTTQAEELEAQRLALSRANGELEEARGGLERRAAELATVSEYKSQFLANMSHELRTPLNSMLLLSNLLVENDGGRLDDRQVEFARTIHAAGKDLLVLINQVLDLAKIEAGKQQIRVAPIPLRPLLAHVERVFQPLAREKDLTFAVEIADDTPDTIATDGQRLEQIVTNLLANAIKFTARGKVTLRVGPPGAGATFRRPSLDAARAVAFAVSDTGVGIGAKDQERIFAPFEQVDSASDRRHGGTGLGLSISRELAELLGGELSLESAAGRGSTFTCTLPFEAPATADTTRAEPAPPAPAATATGRAAAAARASAALERTPPPRRAAAPAAGPGGPPAEPLLLVIEDDRRFAEPLAEIIRGQGLACEVAGDGQTGLRLARERRPLGILLDVKLPDIDGWKVMEELRLDPETAEIPVHFVSAVDASERAMALGAVGYLTKPATRQDLLGVVESLVSKIGGASRRVLVVEDDATAGESLLKTLAAEGMEVLHAASAGQALQALERERFGCMILDLSLPDMDGLSLLERVRERHGAHMPSVVVYTARALSTAEAKALEAHTEAVVLKEGTSTARLLDEVRLFVRRLEQGLGPRRPLAPRLHPVEVNLAGKRILVADDDMRTVYALSATLRAKGMEVLVADNGKSAVATLASGPAVDAVLMDIMMPEMDGYEAMRRIRQDPRFGELLIVALTAKAMKDDPRKCIEAGASAYLPKPIDADRLLAMLHTRLSGGAVP